MKILDFVKKNLGSWITAAIVLVIGILCIVAGAQYNAANGGDINAITSASDTTNAISLTLGIAFIVVGSLGIILALIGAIFAKKGFAAAASVSGVSLTAGIWFVVEKTAFTMIALLISFVPYLILVLGCIMFVDTTLTLINAILGKNIKSALAALIVGYLIAAAAIVIGSLCLAEVITSGAQLIIFGILVILYAVFMVAATFIEMPAQMTVITVTKTEEAPAAEKAE